MTLSTIPSEPLILLEPNVIGWYFTICWNVLCKNWIVVFKVKVTGRYQNFIESLSVLYLMYHLSLCHQIRCIDVLLLVLLILN